MTSERDDLLQLFSHAWDRLVDRMTGLSKAEWMWSPTPDDRISVQWRLAHITAMLSEDRNWTWLGAEAPHRAAGPSMDPAAAIQAGVEAYTAWRDLLTTISDGGLAAPIGSVAGAYGETSRRSFVLHVVDELIHHAAEAALLRDLYAAMVTG